MEGKHFRIDGYGFKLFSFTECTCVGICAVLFFLLLFSLQIVKAGSIQFISNSMLPVGQDLEFAKQSTQDI